MSEKITPGRRVETLDDLERPGDYTGPHTVSYPDGSEREAIDFLLPIHEGEDMYDRPTEGSGLHMITAPPWTFRECADGSLEVRASILCGRTDERPEGYWHGYLDEGHRWREV